MRVRFGPGVAGDLVAEVDDLTLGSLLVVCTPGHRELAERLSEPLRHRRAGLLDGARMHVPQEDADRARAEAQRLGADGLLAVGGGSAIGLAKAVALTTGLPVVAVPTTYAGSEMTSIWGISDGTTKRTGRDRRVLPVSVLYDPALTLSLPVEVSVTSGMNALAHAAEALYAPDRSPVVSLMADDGIRRLVRALPRIVSAPTDLGARTSALYGAWLCGACLGATTMSLHHRLCHALGGVSSLPHAATHTVVLPHVLALNLPAVPDVASRLEQALGGPGSAGAQLYELAALLGAPSSLRSLGMPETDLTTVVDQVLSAPYANPRPVSRLDLVDLLARAWSGAPPRT
ncbi:maleylacetate reductase [Angustibacter luteus]|uniref:Maleylacetate reductase n=1 Tax=Angustibacter luteus TaxID=658456 RepID=A0ABW1JIB0_9ACTN